MGSTVSIETGGFTKPITKGTLDEVELFFVSDDEIVIPALIDAQVNPRPGLARVLVLSSEDDTESATMHITVNVHEFSVVTIGADFNVGEENSIAFLFEPALEAGI